MKLRIILIILITVIIYSCSKENNVNTLNEGLIAYYPFNGNVKDESGNLINVSFYAALLTYDRFYNPNSAYYFNGINNYISLLKPEKFIGLNKYSISLWVKPIDMPLYSAGIIIGFGSAYSPYLQCIAFQANSTFFAICYNNGKNPFYSFSQSPLFETNNWAFIVVTRDNTSISMYLNGTRVLSRTAEETNNQDVNYGPEPFAAIIGGRSNLDPEFFFKGVIDEVRIYNRVLTVDEITQLKSH